MRKINLLLLSILGSMLYNNANAQTCPDNNHPHMIDLGLPTGALWACCNVGATKPEEYGGYFAWGETEEKGTYITEKQYDSIAHNIPGEGVLFSLKPNYDVAHVKWGDEWLMPTLYHFMELIDNCKYEWTTINGIKGGKFIGPNGGCIFLPAAGIHGDRLGGINMGGSYWSSSSLNSGKGEAFPVIFGDGDIVYNILDFKTRYGLSVRPIVKKLNYKDVCPDKFQEYSPDKFDDYK